MGVFIGGFIAEYFNWQGCLYFLFIYNGFLCVLSLFLKETVGKKDIDALRCRHLLMNYIQVMMNRNLLVFSLMTGFSTAVVYIFTAVAPFILIRYLGCSEGVYGVLAMIPFIGQLTGSLLLVRYSGCMNSKQWIGLGLLLDVFAVLFLLVFFTYHVITVYSLLIPVFFLFFGHAIISSTAWSLFVITLTDKGNGVSVGNFIYLSVAVLSTLVLTLLHSMNHLVLPFIYLGLIVMMLLLFFFGRGCYEI